jgi:hypothetical protein
MPNNAVLQDLKEQKQDTSFDKNLMHFNLKMVCFAGLFPYEKICNTPRKLQLYHAYQISLYILYFPIFLSHFMKLYEELGDLQVAIETFTHIVMGIASYICPLIIDWDYAYKVTCKVHMYMTTESTIKIDNRMMDILRETQRNCKHTSLFMIILGMALLCCDLYDIFILHFVEYIAGVEHKYKMNPNAANMYESLLLQKYPFSCWLPFAEMSITWHLATYIYITLPVLAMALRAGAMVTLFTAKITYVSLQFQFVSKALEDISNIEDSDNQIQDNTFSSLEEQHTCDELNYRKFQVPAGDDESCQTLSQENVPKCWNISLYNDKSISTADCLKGKEHEKCSDRLHPGNKSSPEDCLASIIKGHQEAIW